MSYSESEFKLAVHGITHAIMRGAIESGAAWYCENGDGEATHVIFGRADVTRGASNEGFVTLRPFDRGMSAAGEIVYGAAVVYTAINSAERDAIARGDGNLLYDKLTAAASAAAPRLADFALGVMGDLA